MLNDSYKKYSARDNKITTDKTDTILPHDNEASQIFQI